MEYSDTEIGWIARALKIFTTRYGINRWNLNTLEKEPERDIFQVSWLQYLVEDYKVSPFWLLMGGDHPFFQPKWDAEKVREYVKETDVK